MSSDPPESTLEEKLRRAEQRCAELEAENAKARRSLLRGGARGFFLAVVLAAGGGYAASAVPAANRVAAFHADAMAQRDRSVACEAKLSTSDGARATCEARAPENEALRKKLTERLERMKREAFCACPVAEPLCVCRKCEIPGTLGNDEP